MTLAYYPSHNQYRGWPRGGPTTVRLTLMFVESELSQNLPLDVALFLDLESVLCLVLLGLYC